MSAMNTPQPMLFTNQLFEFIQSRTFGMGRLSFVLETSPRRSSRSPPPEAPRVVGRFRTVVTDLPINRREKCSRSTNYR
jgi:hypothetical protein